MTAGALALTALPLASAPAHAAGAHSPAARTAGTRPAATGDDVHALLLDRWTQVLLGGPVPPGNADYATAVAAQDRTARGYLAKIDTAAGRTTPWDDLPLGTASANVTGVAGRLRAIALSRATPASALYGSAEAGEAVAAGVRIVHDAAYHPGQEEYGNWWDWEIGTAKALGDTCVLLGPALPAQTLAAVLAAIDAFVPDPRRMLRNTLDSTGANRVDLCRAVAVRGALGRDPGRLALASSSLAGVLDPVLVGDGFHPDGSFVMHTCVAYPGTYGEVLIQGMAALMRLLSGTPWEVAANERDRTVAAVRDGFAPFLHAGVVADSVRGRAVSRTGERDADDGFLLAVDTVNLAAALPAAGAGTATGLKALAKGWLQRNTWRALSSRTPAQIATVAGVLADGSVQAADGPFGHFAFPDMERFVHRRPGWTFSLALNSDRIARYEYMNGENAKGWHTGDGMAQLHLDTDPFHYTGDYWPTVDAARLPGTTVDTAPLPPGEGGDNDHVPLTGTRWSGGVRLGGLGLVSLDLTGIDSPLTARKSWLLLDDAVVAAGSGIAAPGRHVETVVENRRTEAALTVDGSPPPADPAPARWAHLDGTGGYVFLGGRPVLHTLREARTGAWRDLSTGGPAAPLTRNYTTLWLDHGTGPAGESYCWLQLPGASPATVAARAARPGVEVAALTRDVHAFRTADGVTAAVFFAPGSAAGITVDAPCSVLVREDGPSLRVAVADPSRSTATVTVSLARAGRGSVTDVSGGLTVLSAEPLRLLAEVGARHGASLGVTLRRGEAARRHSVHLLTPGADATAGPSGGDGAVLTVDAANRAYLAFDLSPVRGTVRRAVLWLYGGIPNDPATRADDLYQTVLRAHGPASWTGAAFGDPGPALGEGWATVYPDWTSFEVTPALAGAGRRVCLAVAEDTAGHGVLFRGRESAALRPVLEVITS